MPRRFAITPDRRDKLLNALRAGALYRDAAEAAGIPWSTWTDWSRAVKAGECNDDDVTALVAAAREAYAATNVGLTASVAKASQKDWRAAAWLAEHRQGASKAAAEARRAQHEATIAKNRAEGTHVDRVSVDTPKTREELIAEARSIAAAIEADAPTKH
jgi:hypothetical protein